MHPSFNVIFATHYLLYIYKKKLIYALLHRHRSCPHRTFQPGAESACSGLVFVKSNALAALVLWLAAVEALASSLPFDNCFTSAAAHFGVEKRLLVAIAKTESSFNPHAMGPKNSNGTYDMGMMQINSSWLSTLSRFGIAGSDLMGACTNIHVGAWILAKNIGTHGATWKAVGAYNATTPSKQITYVSRVQRNYALVGSLP